MSKAFPRVMQRLMEEFSKMPGIGVRSAQRLAFYILRSSQKDIDSIISAIREVKANVRFCKTCNNLSEGELCLICSDPSRDTTKVCVVEVPSGVIAMEKSGAYDGVYHVLLGTLSPLDGVGPGDLKIEELIGRVKKHHVREVIIATDFTTEGETTALYLFKVLKGLNVKVTRLARGVPVGGSLEYADIATLQRAFEDRRGVV